MIRLYLIRKRRTKDLSSCRLWKRQWYEYEEDEEEWKGRRTADRRKGNETQSRVRRASHADDDRMGKAGIDSYSN